MGPRSWRLRWPISAGGYPPHLLHPLTGVAARHAGLVLDVSEEGGSTLEAVLIGTDSAIMDTQHWLDYSNYLVLRLRDMTPVLQEALTAYAVEYLNGVPYRLTSGF